MRLDKFLCDLNIGSRTQIKTYVKQGLISVNGIKAAKADMKVEKSCDIIKFRGEICVYKKYVYYMLNKPKGVVSATNDNTCQTVNDLLKETGYKDLFPVGRLDKDAEGLLLMTNDGEMAHKLLTPKKGIKKVYYVKIKKQLSVQDIKSLETGVDIGEAQLTKPAEVQIITDSQIYLTITEGKYHQVKRMMKSVHNEVLYLRRISMGNLRLDEELKAGKYRELTTKELESLLFQLSTNVSI